MTHAHGPALPHGAPRRCSTPDPCRQSLGGHAAEFGGNLGQFAGPLVLGVWVEHFGWSAAPALVVPAAVLGLGAALVLRRIAGTRVPASIHERNDAARATIR